MPLSQPCETIQVCESRRQEAVLPTDGEPNPMYLDSSFPPTNLGARHLHHPHRVYLIL